MRFLMSVFLVLLVLLVSPLLAADYVPPATTSTVTVEVKNVVPERPLTAREWAFLQTVPERDAAGTWGLRKAVKEMLLAGVIHVPPCGQYNPSWEKDYWRMYQVWTAKKVVQVPVVQGPPGPPRPPGPPGELKLEISPPAQPEEQLVLHTTAGPKADRWYDYRLNGFERFWAGILPPLTAWVGGSSIRPSRIEVNQTGGGATVGAISVQGSTATATGGSATSSSSSSSSSASSAAAAADANLN